MRRMSRRIVQAQLDLFLERLATGLTVGGAAKAAGIARRTAYNRREADKEFAAAWDDAYEEGSDAIVDALVRRAMHGVPRKQYYQGVEIDGSEYREFSDALLLAAAKARRPEQFRERYDISQRIDLHVDHAAEILAARQRAGLPDGGPNAALPDPES